MSNERRRGMNHHFGRTRSSRRDVLRGISLTALTSPFLGCGSESEDTGAEPIGDLGEPLACQLYPEATEGPFYVETPELNRADLLEGETSPTILDAIPLSLVMKPGRLSETRMTRYFWVPGPALRLTPRHRPPGHRRRATEPC